METKRARANILIQNVFECLENTRGPVTAIAKMANDKSTWRRISDAKVARFQMQMQAIGERERENRQRLLDFINAFVDNMHPDDANKAMLNLSTNQQVYFQCIYNLH